MQFKKFNVSISISVLSWLALSSSLAAQSKKNVLLFAQMPTNNKIHVPNLEFALALRQNLEEHPWWSEHVVSAETNFDKIGSMLVISSQKNQPAFETVQKAIDTFALDGALIASCQSFHSNSVKACSVKYYDRVKKGIIAKAEKEFAVPLNDTTRWPQKLLARLTTGLTHQEGLEKQRLVNTLLIKSEEHVVQAWQFGMRVGAESLGAKGGISSPGSTNVFAFKSKVASEGAFFGGEFAYQLADTERHHFNGQQYSLLFGLQSDAQESLKWILGLGLGYARRALTAEGSSEKTVEDALILTIRPELAFKISKRWHSSIDFRYNHFNLLKRQASAPDSTPKLAPDSIATTLGLTYFF